MFDSEILKNANVPEHSIYFMQAVSGAKAFVQDDYLCFSDNSFLTIIGYPLTTTYSDSSFLNALEIALKKTMASQCFTVSPHLPTSLQQYVQDEDNFYTLPVESEIPKKLVNPIKKAKATLRVDLTKDFTKEHRRLFTEFMSRVALKPMVRRLFASTELIFKKNIDELYLLNAWNTENKLVACLLLDFAPIKFTSYILGAHSKSYYSPHAHDLLFEQMIAISKEKQKEYIHLGLGVNHGITRFKEKWGGKKSFSFLMASWQAEANAKNNESISSHAKTILKAVINSEKEADLLALISKPKYEVWNNLPKQRPYAMLWEVKKNKKTSYIGGSAHFFCYSFERAFTNLFNRVDTVLFEGPLDEDSLAIVKENGTMLTDEYKALYPFFTKEEIQKLSRMVRGPEGFWHKLLNMEAKEKIDVEWVLKHTRPWTSLFTLWTGYLERNGWKQSVDLEGWYLAQSMGKTVVAMESLEEQLASLNSVPPERVVSYFRDCHKWPNMIKENVKAYLAGDLMRLMGTSAEFPTRTKTIISMRDERFRLRMRPFMEEGACMVFVGTAHMLNLRNMLVEDGFTLKQISIK